MLPARVPKGNFTVLERTFIQSTSILLLAIILGGTERAGGSLRASELTRTNTNTHTRTQYFIFLFFLFNSLFP